MIAGVADTHAALWHLFDDKRLSGPAEDFIDQAASARNRIAVSSISLADVVYLIEKNRLPHSAYDDLRSALSDPDHVLKEAALLFKSLRPCGMFPAQMSQICRIVS